MLKVLLAGAMTIALVTVTSPAAMAQAPTAPSTKPASKSQAASGGQQAMRERQKKCGAEWKEAKAAGKVAKDMKWPKYWSECNTRLKGQGA
jgi:hypothetical protein